VASGPLRAEDSDPKIFIYAESCLRALIRSTCAFHNVGDPGQDRLIVTNIWGTAHAQWGNVVTLLAAYDNAELNGILARIISVDELRSILCTTLAFLKLNVQHGSSLRVDYKILKHMGQKLKLLPQKGVKQLNSDPSTSFGSNNSRGDVTMSG